MHTPPEAAHLWCPMVRIGVTHEAGGPSSVNDPKSPYNGTCIATKCAMWRWEPSNDYGVVTGKGFCGLAGGSAL